MSKYFIFSALMISTITALAQVGPVATTVDWSQPPLACIENLIPSVPDRPCPDLSQVIEITKDITKEINLANPDDDAFWKNPANKKALNYCRSEEILRRNEQAPGSVTAGSVQISWMRMTAMQGAQQKLAAIMAGSSKYKIPAYVLLGALIQESLLSDLGISDDGGNFSCGAGQINVLEWCRWANKQSPERKNQMAWPLDVRCENLQTEWVRPFQQIALQKMQNLPSYRLNKEYFKDITFADVEAKLGGASLKDKKRNFSTLQSFINNCGNATYGIEAKAHELSLLFKNNVPRGLREREIYPPGQSFQQNCQYKDQSGYYPLHTGWLLAVGAYNAGPKSTEVFPYYYGLNKQDADSAEKMSTMDPRRLVEGLYFGGKYNAATDRYEYMTLAGAPASNLAFKQCVLHQHVVRIVQHVTRSGEPMLLSTLSEVDGCRKEIPASEFRRTSSGLLEAK